VIIHKGCGSKMAFTRKEFNEQEFIRIRDFLKKSFQKCPSRKNWLIDRWNFCRYFMAKEAEVALLSFIINYFLDIYNNAILRNMVRIRFCFKKDHIPKNNYQAVMMFRVQVIFQKECILLNLQWENLNNL